MVSHALVIIPQRQLAVPSLCNVVPVKDFLKM